MIRYIAFLRAINVGGHVVTMDRLRTLFESLGVANVQTFIASGNVIFDSPSKSARALETRIERQLRDALGYEVATFLRTDAEVDAVAGYRPFTKAALDAARALNIAFLAGPPDVRSKEKVMALRTEVDDFHVHGREVFWLCRKMQSKSKFSNAVLERALGAPSTLRGANTVRKIAEKFAPAKR